MVEGRKVGIVGAGINGLLACKYALSKGLNPIVFECKNAIGGVWSKTIESTKLQTPKPTFEFADFPWPSYVDDLFPASYQVLDYVESYAKHFDLVKYVRFNTKVISVSCHGIDDDEKYIDSWELWGGNGETFSDRRKWDLTVQDLVNLSTELVQVDFLILCLGKFSDVPNIPKFPEKKGPEAFKGQVIHAMDFAAMDYKAARDFVKGKRVAVIGFKKSALDIAMQISKENGLEHPCTMVFRNSHWSFGRIGFPWGLPIRHLFFSRFAELMMHKPGEGFLLGLAATILSPVRWAMSKLVDWYINSKHPLKKHKMLPEHSFVAAFESGLIAMAPDGFYESVDNGSIVLNKSSSFTFCKQGLLLEGESAPLDVDLVIFATGFKGDQKVIDIFESSKFRDNIAGPSFDTIAPLYRQCIHPRLPQLAVMGFIESRANLHAFEMKCRWLAELLAGTFKLPSVKKMEKEVSQWDAFLRRNDLDWLGRSYYIGALQTWYNDLVCQDMGCSPKRKKGFLDEWFQPYGPMDYARL